MSTAQLDPVLVGQVIARLRREKGLTQEVLSGLADIGRTHLSAIENGQRKPTLETIFRLCALSQTDRIILQVRAIIAKAVRLTI